MVQNPQPQTNLTLTCNTETSKKKKRCQPTWQAKNYVWKQKITYFPIFHHQKFEVLKMRQRLKQIVIDVRADKEFKLFKICKLR